MDKDKDNLTACVEEAVQANMPEGSKFSSGHPTITTVNEGGRVIGKEKDLDSFRADALKETETGNKWFMHRQGVSASVDDGKLRISVEDNGPLNQQGSFDPRQGASSGIQAPIADLSAASTFAASPYPQTPPAELQQQTDATAQRVLGHIQSCTTKGPKGPGG